MQKKVLVGLSGGVDSAVSAYLLMQQGYEVTAGFMINYISDDEENCTTKKDLEVAKEVAEFLKIPFFTFDYVKEYEKIILDYIYDGYQKGITPNPDVFCNSEVKFKVFLDEAIEGGFDYIATGHYARIQETSSPALLLKEKGVDYASSTYSVGLREGYSLVPEYVKEIAKDLRKNQTKTEDIIWKILRKRQFENLKFRRQHPFGRYIADFYCAEISLVIEIDGKIHEYQKEYDAIRDEIISTYGVQILRIKNEEILDDIEGVFKKIFNCIPSPLRRGLGGGKENTSSPTLLLEEKGEIYHLLKGVDRSKDQSYFLSFLNQEQLSRSLFPIGHLQKKEVREIAEKIGLPNATRKDSQGLCFVGKVDFEEFLKKKLPVKKGKIVDTRGKILGEHDGVYFYTIGQRKGLKLGGLENPVFVIGKNIEKNELIVGADDEKMLYGRELTTNNIHFVGEEITFPITGKAKIRYRQEDQDVTVSLLQCPSPLNGSEKLNENETGGNTKYLWKFHENQRAIAAGQVASFYDGEELIFSGVIE